ncbi:hypothetical protein BCR44DRAFT_1430295 [Catenaria anguillulae PL171]|uniref:Uncharacterized protein n=1 Tax=Catenaria anguillulae PL171 TaxID=765915 RepID=A0A1Y2HSA5_9FUNG|nr:hypothetical protein BCR44DRAFT_1430295 [Catenaria anguillulae PL171]
MFHDTLSSPIPPSIPTLVSQCCYILVITFLLAMWIIFAFASCSLRPGVGQP